MIDAALQQGWPLKRIETVLRAILRAGAYELDRARDVPARVVVSEYVDVAHAFVEGDETGMVNAVLDQLARGIARAEFDQPRGEAMSDTPTATIRRGPADRALFQADRAASRRARA